MEKKKYINPITIEAELFVNNFECLSKVYKEIDAVLVSSLEKVMNAIESFLDSNPSEIVATANTELVTCNDIDHIKRIYYCVPCKQDIGKSVEKVSLHLTNNCIKRDRCGSSSKEIGPRKLRGEMPVEKDIKKKGKRSDPVVKLTKKTISLLTSDLSQFIADQAKISKKLTCLPAYDDIENELKSLITTLFPHENVKIYKFGSRIAGIGNKESDLDLYVDIGDSFNTLQNRADVQTINKLQKVCHALKKDTSSWKCLVMVDKARVPILKVMHSPTGIECDINFSNSLGTINTKFLEYIFELQPIAQFLCTFMRKWLIRTRFNENSNTYSIILMVLFYLQTEGVVPSMERLQRHINLEKALYVGPWLCTYATLTLNELEIPLESVNQPNLLKFVRGFFLFYTNFKFDKDAICPYLGYIIKKDDLENLMPLRYIKFVMESPEFSLQLDKSIVVQDPFQLNHNTTKGLADSILKNFKSYLISSLEKLNETFPH